MAAIQAGRGNTQVADAMRGLVKDPNGASSIASSPPRIRAERHPAHHLCRHPARCGHATNALPQRARANINCRIFPESLREAVRAKLEELVADPAVKVTTLETRGPSSPPPPLTREILAPVEKLAAQFFPGVPVVPILQPGATDGQFLNAAGIPTYGIEPLFAGPDLGHIHGLNEYVSVQSLLDCRDFLYRLIKMYSDQG